MENWNVLILVGSQCSLGGGDLWRGHHHLLRHQGSASGSPCAIWCCECPWIYCGCEKSLSAEDRYPTDPRRKGINQALQVAWLAGCIRQGFSRYGKVMRGDSHCRSHLGLSKPPTEVVHVEHHADNNQTLFGDHPSRVIAVCGPVAPTEVTPEQVDSDKLNLHLKILIDGSTAGEC